MKQDWLMSRVTQRPAVRRPSSRRVVASFYDELIKFDWERVSERIQSKNDRDVRAALENRRCTLDDFMALVSPAAASHLPAIKNRSSQLTKRRFGNVIQMYVPMYLSNECTNICTYCGFSLNNQIKRLTLNEHEILQEAHAIKQMGFDHVLLVSGESPRNVGVDYFLTALHLLRPHFSNIALEVQPLDEEEYRILQAAGLHSVLVYQETYNQENYRKHHLKGKKANYRHRLETPDRLGRAEVHKIGLGILIGLEDWRTDAFFMAAHLSYLRRKYWKTRFSVSFPRLRPAEGMLEPKVVMSESELKQLICAFRLFDENLELSLSTRERAAFRDEAINIGITSVSAGSRTDPGGYSTSSGALKQFEIDDNRTPQEVASAIRSKGFEVVWKDWDRAFDAGINATGT
ncbi:MAG: 2-iminoacetate synthase ThiH [Deltaproteobacteria bacterium]|nr:2-iminoacetate synthase ThiH [Deltaproteobacteria bacterium]